MLIARTSLRVGLLLVFSCLLLAAVPVARARDLSFDERVAAQKAIEQVYWNHRIWPKENPGPKPPLSEVMPDSAIRTKVEDSLRMSALLDSFWHQPLSGEQLQAEIERMARQTKAPETLRDLFDALDNDPFLIAECLARPVLAERLVSSAFAGDERIHGAQREELASRLAGVEDLAALESVDGDHAEITFVLDDADAARSAPSDPTDRAIPVAREEWNAEIVGLAASFGPAPEPGPGIPQAAGTLSAPVDELSGLPLGLTSRLLDRGDQFVVLAVRANGPTSVTVASVSWTKRGYGEWAREAAGSSTPDASPIAPPPRGYLSPALLLVGRSDDPWTSTAELESAAHFYQTVIWTGSEMIVWGGTPDDSIGLHTGGRYNPSTDSWAASSLTNGPGANVPVGRREHTAVWTGSEMIVWGGTVDGSIGLNTGGRYNPSTDSWVASSLTDGSGPNVQGDKGVSTLLVCDDMNPCTDDVLDPGTQQCTYTPDDSNTCDDGNPCTTGETCGSGQCSTCPYASCAGTTATYTNTTPLPIPDNGPVVTSTIAVSGVESYLVDVNLTTFIRHTFNEDLDITLRSPAGTVATISTDNGTSADNVFDGTVWDDQADPGSQVPYSSNPNIVVVHTYTNFLTATPLTPEEPLGAFIGENPNGTWTLSVRDDVGIDSGSLQSWSLEMTTLTSAPIERTAAFTNTTPVAISATGTSVVTSTLAVSTVGNKIGRMRVTTFLRHTENEDLDITLMSPSGRVVTLTTDNGEFFENVFNGTLWSDKADPDSQIPYPLPPANRNIVTDHTYANLVTATPLTPEEGLAAFNGEDPNGTWTLTISDDLHPNGGSLNGWTLEVTTVECPACATNCDDGDPCTDDTCDPSVSGWCVHTPHTGPCDDDNACTMNETCSTGACVGTLVSCNDGNVCTNDGCNPTTGCTHTNNMASCDDADACTQTDTCQAGTCTASNPIVCTALDECHVVGTCNPANGICSNPNATKGTACDDSDSCTQTDTCQLGVCRGSNPVPDNTACDDGNPCTVGENCRSICLAQATFAPAAGSPVAAGTQPVSVAIGDWNGDGRSDLAVANQSSNNVTILLGNGSGGFSQAAGSPVTVGSSPFSVAVGDWNADGKTDLGVANQFTNNNVTILLGNGLGGFTQAAGSPVAVGSTPYSIAVGDVSGDSKLDLAVVNNGSNNVTILLGNGLGGFTQAAGSPVGVGLQPYSIAMGDMSGDGKLDLAVANNDSNNVTVLLGNGSGGFSQAAGSPVAVGSRPRSVAGGDVNGDGKLDLAVANSSSANVTILLGNGSGGFFGAAGSPVAAGSSPRSVAVGELNNDDRLDVVVANLGSSNVTVLLGIGSGAFRQAGGSPVGVGAISPFSLAVGSLNGDAKLDLAVANFGGNVSILLNNTISAPNGTACNDGNACTESDACTGGGCSGTAVPPPSEVDNGVRVARSGGVANITWNLATGATSSAVLRGLMSGLPVGPSAVAGDETCLANGLSSTTLTWPDAINPATGASFWYLVRGDHACGEGPYGFQRRNGVPTVPRVSTTCP